MVNILSVQSAEMWGKGDAMIQQADRLFCQSWNEQMWSDGEPIALNPQRPRPDGEPKKS
jgi:hypothetical protein